MNDQRETPWGPPAKPAPARLADAAFFLLLAGLFVAGIVSVRRADLLVLIAVLLAGWAAMQMALAIRRFAESSAAERLRAEDRLVRSLESQVLPALVRIAEALERPAATTALAAPEGLDRPSLLADARRAIAAGQWKGAERLARDFARDFPDDPASRRLCEEVDAGRVSAISGLKARLEAAREVRDADRVIAIRDELAEHLEGDPRRELDREVVSWLMGLIRRGLSELPLRPDVVELATRVADRFDETIEGASLRKSLPVLRRSVGLCPRCAKPYAGIEAACPECLAGVTAPRLARIDDEAAPADGPGESSEDSIFSYPDSPFLDRERAD